MSDLFTINLLISYDEEDVSLALEIKQVLTQKYQVDNVVLEGCKLGEKRTNSIQESFARAKYVLLILNDRFLDSRWNQFRTQVVDYLSIDSKTRVLPYYFECRDSKKFHLSLPNVSNSIGLDSKDGTMHNCMKLALLFGKYKVYIAEKTSFTVEDVLEARDNLTLPEKVFESDCDETTTLKNIIESRYFGDQVKKPLELKKLNGVSVKNEKQMESFMNDPIMTFAIDRKVVATFSAPRQKEKRDENEIIEQKAKEAKFDFIEIARDDEFGLFDGKTRPFDSSFGLKPEFEQPLFWTFHFGDSTLTLTDSDLKTGEIVIYRSFSLSIMTNISYYLDINLKNRISFFSIQMYPQNVHVIISERI